MKRPAFDQTVIGFAFAATLGMALAACSSSFAGAAGDGGRDAETDATLDAEDESDVQVLSPPDSAADAPGDGPLRDAAVDGPCGAGMKRCNGNCVKSEDPGTGFGCLANSCSPIGDPNACGYAGDAQVVCWQIDMSAPYCVNCECVSQCPAPYRHCTTQIDAGCETNIGTDPRNCGGCGIVCDSGACDPATQQCRQ
jgi:hypothetical protein